MVQSFPKIKPGNEYLEEIVEELRTLNVHIVDIKSDLIDTNEILKGIRGLTAAK